MNRDAATIYHVTVTVTVTVRLTPQTCTCLQPLVSVVV